MHAAHACGRARARAQVRHKLGAEGVLAWADEQGLAGELGGPAHVAAMALRALLVAGAKSFTHMITALERYHGLLAGLLAAAGPAVRAVKPYKP
jgi:nuclear cap-binding protein subunit 1